MNRQAEVYTRAALIIIQSAEGHPDELRSWWADEAAHRGAYRLSEFDLHLLETAYKRQLEELESERRRR